MTAAVTRLLLNASMSCALGCWARNRMLRAIGVGLQPDSKISRGTRLGGPNITAGFGFGANEECWFDEDVHFGRNVRVGPRVSIFTKGHPRGGPRRRRGDGIVTVGVTVGDGVWLHGGVTIMPGAHIAPGCIIAGGAVVVRRTEPNGYYAGNPAVRLADLADDGSLVWNGGRRA